MVVVGGLGSLAGAFVASLLIGLVQTFAVAFDVSLADLFGRLGVTAAPGPGILGDVWRVTIAQIAPILPYLLLVLVLTHVLWRSLENRGSHAPGLGHLGLGCRLGLRVDRGR